MGNRKTNETIVGPYFVSLIWIIPGWRCWTASLLPVPVASTDTRLRVLCWYCDHRRTWRSFSATADKASLWEVALPTSEFRLLVRLLDLTDSAEHDLKAVEERIAHLATLKREKRYAAARSVYCNSPPAKPAATPYEELSFDTSAGRHACTMFAVHIVQGS